MRRLLALSALTLTAAFAAEARAEVTVLRDFTLIDGTGRPAAVNSAMVIDNGRITWVGPTGKLKAPAKAAVVNLKGKYVMPGLIDLHVHLGNVKDMVQDKKFFTQDNVEQDLRTYAAYGVTTVESLGTDSDLIFRLRAAQRAGRPTMARVYTAGQGFVFKGGYGGLAGVNQPVSSPAEIDREVAAQAAKGVDIIKLWLDDELGTMPKMPPEITKAIIDSAHKRGLRAVAHVFYLQDAKRLVAQGIDGFAHSVRDKPIDQELIDGMKRHGTWQLAETLSREASMFAYGERAPFLDDPFFKRGVSAQTLKILADAQRQKTVASAPHFHDYPAFLQTAEQNLGRLRAAGVPIGFGTDAGPPGRFPGYFEHWELQLMVQAGITPAEAIATATGRAAQFLRAKDLGTLQPTKWADLVVLDADPLTDIRNTRKIDAVYVAGRKVRSIWDK
ncbi:amidohydrolase [Phenylobacterium hankyongense]|uniref:Amidohydrolase n=1 Tax=Phenylobacterium hankyongense TaxID=1813876 RepID=A0A328B4K0_9CAUL|nr:amidohydrolase [Phenylobacterium hankyongense]